MKQQLSETVTVRVSGETKLRLAELAGHTRRSKSFLVGEAISDYVERELNIIAGVSRGLEDIEHGRVTPHGEAMRRIRRVIADAAKAK